MREKSGYRDVLESIIRANDGALLVTKKKACEILGLNPRTVEKRYQIGKSGIPAALLARKMLGE